MICVFADVYVRVRMCENENDSFFILGLSNCIIYRKYCCYHILRPVTSNCIIILDT